MIHVSHNFKKAVESSQTPDMTKLILLTVSQGDTIAAERHLERALLILKQSNREVYPHLTKYEPLN